ncbi:hypothetical protein L596_006263 [Steinernema carpocapsae]|uniref:Uncharacterized protein n=1 Tax=Steinernema carpocapsae TaxID=34508 RepID=A0A4U8V341_STECR|nr:hypothetical protein L596_006263 [Steinernema carpocapsae]
MEKTWKVEFVFRISKGGFGDTDISGLEGLLTRFRRHITVVLHKTNVNVVIKRSAPNFKKGSLDLRASD